MPQNFMREIFSTLSYILHDKRLIAFLLFIPLLLEWRRGYFSGFKTYLKSLPLKRDLLQIGIFAFFILLLMPFDQKLLTLIQHGDEKIGRWVIPLGTHLGKDAWLYLMTFYFGFLALRNHKWRQVIFGAILGSLLTTGVTNVFKFFFLRSRPSNHLGPFSFFNLTGLTRDDAAFQSFSSGDVALVAGATTYLAAGIKNPALRLLVSMIPFTTAFARVSLDRHWPSDTLCSIAISFMVAQFLIEFNRKINCSC